MGIGLAVACAVAPLPALVCVLAAGCALGSAFGPGPDSAFVLAGLAAGALLVVARFAWTGARVCLWLPACAATLTWGAALGTLAEWRAWEPPGFDIAALEKHVAGGEAVRVAGRLRRDAFMLPGGGVALDVEVDRLWWRGRWLRTQVGARLTVVGDRARAARGDWTRGRRIEAPLGALRRPLPYRNFGVSNAERALARQGLRWFGTVKSASLVEWQPAPAWEEAGARARAHIRGRVARTVGDPAAAAVVTAILVGDRSAMDAALVRHLQHAGVYHVVAISGGNVAIWLALLLGVPRLAGLAPRLAVTWLAAGLLAFVAVVDGGASVARASLVASVVLIARWWDLRISGTQALAVAALVLLLGDPLAVHDPGALLSFGAAGALVQVGRWSRVRPGGSSRPAGLALRALAGTVMATLAVEAVLLPITASWFHLATAAGVLANIVAIPAMAAVQVAGLVIAASTAWPWLGEVSGRVAAAGVGVLLRSADVVTLAPWLVREVPPPSALAIVGHYVSLAGLAAGASTVRHAAPGARFGPRSRRSLVVGLACAHVGCVAWIATGGVERSHPQPWTWRVAERWQRASWPHESWLAITVLDVGQGDATVVRLPSGRTWLVDAGGTLSDTFDVGERVTTPALWGLGHRRLARVVVTHLHPDHAGGIPAVLRRLGGHELLTGIDVPGDPIGAGIAAASHAGRHSRRAVRAGESLGEGPVRIDVLHPDAPDWERRRVRNDDSVVLWIRFGDVGMLLPGDVGAATEVAAIAHVAAAPLTVLRLAHHGSATSTGAATVEALRPALALASAGRGNRFGHPAPAVVRRLAAAGVPVLRTDEVGAIQLVTNGRVLLVRTASGLEGSLTSWSPRRAWWPATPPPSGRGSPRPASDPRPARAPPSPGTGG